MARPSSPVWLVPTEQQGLFLATRSKQQFILRQNKNATAQGGGIHLKQDKQKITF